MIANPLLKKGTELLPTVDMDWVWSDSSHGSATSTLFVHVACTLDSWVVASHKLLLELLNLSILFLSFLQRYT
jgi:hypothetical protein